MPQQQRNQQLLQGSQTVPQDDSNELPVLHLTATGSEGQQEDDATTRRVRWSEDTIDNELMNKKKSKICCIFHPNSMDYEEESESSDSGSDSSSSSSSSSGSDEDNGNDGIEDYNRKKLKKRGKTKKKGKKNRNPEDHKHCCYENDNEDNHDLKNVCEHKHENEQENGHENDLSAQEEEYHTPLPNAYEYQPKFRLVKDLEGIENTKEED